MEGLWEWVKAYPTFPLLIISSIVALLGYLSQRHLTKSKNSVEFEALYHDDSTEAKTAKARNLLNNLSCDELINLAATENINSENALAIRDLLNIWERAAIAIRYGVFDENILYKAYATGVINVWKRANPYIKARQQHNPKVYTELDWLVLRWINKKNSENKNVKNEHFKKAQALIEKGLK